MPFVEVSSREELLDTLGDPAVRRVLAAISGESKSAKDIAEECDMTVPTVYRHLEKLLEHDLARDETLIADDGNQYKLFESNFESTVISLEDGEFNIQIYREESLSDSFSQLWDDLHTHRQ